MRQQICMTCRFYTVEIGYGQCRRRPPIPMKYDHKGIVVAEFPRVYGYDWCGEWIDKKETQ